MLPELDYEVNGEANASDRLLDSKTESKPKNNHKLGLLFVRKLWGLIRELCPSFKSRVFGLYLLFLLTNIVEQIVVYFVGNISSSMYVVLVAKDLFGFLRVSVISILKLLAIAIIYAFRLFVDQWLQLTVRGQLSGILQTEYLKHKRFYQVNALQNSIDNADQRITDDVNKFSIILGEILAKLIVWPILLVYYTYDCAKTAGWTGPVMVFGYFILGFVTNSLLANLLVKLYFRQETREGDYRYLHVNIRTKSESIYFLDGTNEELVQVDTALSRVIANLWRIAKRKFAVDLPSQFFSYMGAALSYFIVAIPIFAGEYDGLPQDELSGVISALSFVNMYLIFICTEFIVLFNKFAAAAGYTFRIDEFLQLLRSLPFDEDDSKPFDYQQDAAMADKTPLIMFNDVTLETPTGVLIVQGLSFQVTAGQHVIITGPSGCGKSSILRAMKGLWPLKLGSIFVNGQDLPDMSARERMVIYLPQEPYTTSGTLFDQLTYPVPAAKTNIDGPLIEEILNSVGLLHLLQRFPISTRRTFHDEDTSILSVKWNNELSVGERQRLAFARLFYWRPSLAVLDEATSALDREMSLQLYRSCAELGITTVSVTHHRDYIGVAQIELALTATAGEWIIHDLTT